MTWLGRLFRRDRLELQLDAELRDHFERLVAQYIDEGLSERDARRRCACRHRHPRGPAPRPPHHADRSADGASKRIAHSTHTEVGGRFRLKHKTLKDTGLWRWEDNPFVGTKPYQGLIVMLMMFNSTDLKNTNNTLYEHRTGDLIEQWYVARDIGSAS